MNFRFVCCLIVWANFVWAAPNENTLHEEVHIVQTETGPVDGIHENSKTSKNVIAYYGLPYAKPPVGPRRFARPDALDKKESTEVFHADHVPLPCYQNPPPGAKSRLRKIGFVPNRPWSEDCLKLNIWIPNAEVKDAPVVVYFHGGGFYMGTGLTIHSNGANLASEENVIVVGVNFRLGVLGFMSLGQEHEAPGNMGLYDQQVALIWVHNNIAAFGGDPNKVTIFGCSSGAASVGYHILAPSSRGLFQRAILTSGVPTNPWATHPLANVISKTKEIARNLGYRGEDNPTEILTFLRAQQVEDLIDANEFHSLLSENVVGPTVDGHLITDNPHHLLDKHETDTNVEIMIGSTLHEGSIFLLSHNQHLFKNNEQGLMSKDAMIHSIATIDPHSIDEWVTHAIVNNYIDHERKGDPTMYRDKTIEAFGDYLFSCDIESFADHLAKHGHKVYRYLYAQSPGRHGPFGLPWLGAHHGAEVPLMFGAFMGNQNLGKEFLDFEHCLMDCLGSFLREGDPNAAHKEDNVHWPLYTLNDRASLRLSMENTTVVHHHGADHCAVMRYLVPLVRKVGHCVRGELHHGTDHEKGHHPHHE